MHEKFLSLEKMKQNNWVVEVRNTRKIKAKKVVNVSVRMNFLLTLNSMAAVRYNVKALVAQ